VCGLPALAFTGAALSGDALAHGALAGLASGLGLLALYSSARYLFVGVASAISAVVSCVIPVAYAALTQPTSVREEVGVAVCVLALVSVARWRGDSQVATAPGEGAGAVAAGDGPRVAVRPDGPGAMVAHEGGRLRQEMLGVGAALASGVGLGVYYIALAGASVGQQLGEALESRLVSVLVVAVIALAAQRSSLAPRRATLVSALAAGAFGIVGSLAYATAVRTGSLSVVIPIVSLSPAVTITAAWLVLSERVSNRQLAGLILAMVGVAIVTG
jgi:drug/metabolite transporter (DMT)-like permease